MVKIAMVLPRNYAPKRKKIDINRPDKMQRGFNTTTTMIMNFPVLIILIVIWKSSYRNNKMI
jgi:hypothetical protein